jgi:hypothetical protein
MGKQGQPNFKGIIYQSWAAMSLFLQHLRKANFSYIHLEAPKFQDFNLVFDDSRKIICEAKNWKRKFNYSDLRKILNDILSRKNLGENDEILFICTEINDELEGRVKNAEYFKNTKYFMKEFYPYFKKKKFTDEQINILPQIKFWKVSEDINENLVYLLFEELLDFWLPEDDLLGIINRILIDKIYKGSAKGDTFTRDELFMEIENIKINIIKKTGYLDGKRNSKEKQIKDLMVALENKNSPIWADSLVSALSTERDLMFFVLKRLENKRIKNLSDWGNLWNIIKINYFSHYVFKIFSNNLQNTKNRQYILSFILKNLPNYKSYFLDNFLIIDIVKIIAKIIEKENKLNRIALEIVEDILENYKDDYFYLKSDYDQHRNWEKEQISILLRKLFNKGNHNQKEIIYKQIFNYFNLVEDEGEYWHYTPEIIFEILRDYLIVDYSKFEGKFKQLTNDLIKQYDKLCKKNTIEYKGWEIIGEFTVYSPHKYLIKDKHFICYLLEPALIEYYRQNVEKAWHFISNNCIIHENKVSRIRPDFLNRASIPIILEEYKNKDEQISKEAFIILKEFISSKKGIPNKRKLIFQKLKKDFPDNKNNCLVEEYIKKYKLPYDPFIEDIIIQLAKDGNQRARDIIEEWTSPPDFLEKTEMLGRDVVSRIENYSDYLFPVGLKLFKDYIGRDDFINNDKNIEVYRIANILNKIIYKDFQSGIEIINEIIKNNKLSDNQQILIFYCLLPKSEDINKPENLEIFEKLYFEFLNPFLNNLSNNIKIIEERITQPQAREAIVDFAEALAKNKKIKEVMRIIEIFINDSNPCTPQKIDPKDPDGKYDKHQQIINGEGTNTITTVRGKCAWALMNCITLVGRDYLENIISLTEKLTNDKNLYIQEQSCITLSRLAQVRFSIMPENKEELFFNQDKEKALKMAKKIEYIAFNLLGKFLSLDQKPRNVLMNQLLRVFDGLKSINQESAEKLLNAIIKCNDEVIREAVPLFIYFAEFRHRFYHDWEWSLPGLFDDLADFDNKIFKNTLIEIIKRGNPKINANFAWHFNDIVKNAIGDNKELKSIIGYDEIFKMANYYLNIIAESYDKESFERVYRFIKGNIDKHFKECYELWEKCLRKERDLIEKKLNSIDVRRMYWWPFDNNGEILEIIREKSSNEEFLKSFKFLLDYPIKYYLPDIDKALKILEELPKKYNKEVSELFQKLITKEPKYFDRYEKWKTTNNIA